MQTQTVLQQITYSVGICALIEVETTLRLVSQILTSQNTTVHLREVIVVTPNKILADRLENTDVRLVVVREERREGKTSALREILRRATGEILVLASADIRAGSRSVSQLVTALAANQDLGAVDSQVELINADDKLADRVSILLWELHNETLDELDSEGRLGHVAGDLMAVRRNLVDQLPDLINDDAYIALNAKRKGFGVARVHEALVWIAGPGNPADYVVQRSRVLAGHFELIKTFGIVPTTFEFTLLSRPLRNLRVLARVIRKVGPSYIPTSFAAALLELISLQFAIFQSLTLRRQTPWRIVYTTKRA